MNKVLIVGAGIAGLGLARQLKKLGVPFNLVERRSALTPEGAGIALPANAVRAMRHMGLGHDIDSHGLRVKDIIYAKASGQVLSRASLLDAPLNSDHFVALPRRQLLEILSGGLEPMIQFGTTINDLDRALVDHNVVVGADGMHSQVRRLAFGEVPLVDFGLVNWRWVCRYPTADLQPTYMFGRQNLFMAYPISADTVYCYAQVFDPDQRYSEEGDHRTVLQQLFGDYGGIAATLLPLVPDNVHLISGRFRSVPRPLLRKGDHIALIGDAASARTPVLQQGVACALEDAIVLAELLSVFPSEQALPLYEDYRLKRVTRILESSDAPARLLRLTSSPLMTWVRDIVIRIGGPVNVRGWRELLADDPIAQLPGYINMHRQAAAGAAAQLP